MGQSSFHSDRGSFLSRAQAKPAEVMSPGTGSAGGAMGAVDINDRSLRAANSFGNEASGSEDRNWLNFSATGGGRGGMGDRPTTASQNSNARVAHLENQLKEERR